MFKKFISVLCMFFGILTAAHAGPAANIEYVHKMIAHVWGIEIPYNPELKNPRFAANMEYLLAAVDVANEMLNGYKTTDYKSDPKYATRYIADTLATNKAVHELISVEWPFTVTTTEMMAGDKYEFALGASGTFWVDWGDGTTEQINKPETEMDYFGHQYEQDGVYTVKFRGQATGYQEDSYSGSIMFMPFYTDKIDGNLGKIFRTLPDGTNPSFAYTFNGAVLSSGIPEDLFDGVYGQPREAMFLETFSRTGVTGQIPAGLFAGLDGQPAPHIFSSTFNGCSGLEGTIPADLFAGISGEPAPSMFDRTFYDCSGLTSIEGDLFRNIDGTPVDYMFSFTFAGCTGLQGKMPEHIFGNISGDAAYGMFDRTFDGCAGLTGMSPRNIDGTDLYKNWLYADTYAFSGCTGLDDYDVIPVNWGGLAKLEIKSDSEFALLTTSVSSFGITLTAAGTFTIDWGDGTVETVQKNDTTAKTYNHNYDSYNRYIIGLSGDATDYATYDYDLKSGEVIKFSNVSSIAGITGSLGQVFSTLENGKNPSFATVFSDATSLTGDIPPELFDGITGQPSYCMFPNLFKGTTALTSEIPETLFAGLDGTPTYKIFTQTFYKSGVSGTIPENLFAGIYGAPAFGMFRGTFRNCPNLTGEIPAGLFARISGAPAEEMFMQLFLGTSGLTGTIPENLFAGISGAPAPSMYNRTFAKCSNLSGEIPAGLFGKLDGAPASGMFSGTFGECVGLSGAIPENLFAGISGAPAVEMFAHTFYGCNNLTGIIPAGLFAGIYGAPAASMFQQTFDSCVNLSGLGGPLFARINGAPAESMYEATFYECRGLKGSIPENLFGNLYGAAQPRMFWGTFSTSYPYSGLTGEIPLNLLGTYTSSTPQNQMFHQTFWGCKGLTGPSVRDANGVYLYNYFTTTSSSYIDSMYYNCTGLTDYANIPTAWK